MKHIVVISGKGGTGKTVLTASFAAMAERKVMVDCDVDAADLHLILKPKVIERHEFRAGRTARMIPERCTGCGLCREVCRFEAITEDFSVDGISCEGCAFCSRVCPAGAIDMEQNISGQWFVSDTKYGTMVHARLGIAEENSGKLVACVKKRAKELALAKGLDYIIVDGPPGTGCPVISSLSEADVALIVTEPTLSGMHDMQRVADLAKHFSIPVKVVINKYDLNIDNTKEISRICVEKDLEMIGNIPYSKEVISSVVRGVPAFEFCGANIKKEMMSIWQKMRS